MMPASEMVERAEELIVLAKSFLGTSPYADVRNIKRVFGSENDDFIPDLDTYCYAIWSVCSGIRRVLRNFDAEKLENEIKYLIVPLEERYPQYKHLLAMVTPDNTPRLFLHLERTAVMKEKALIVLSMALSEKQQARQ